MKKAKDMLSVVTEKQEECTRLRVRRLDTMLMSMAQ